MPEISKVTSCVDITAPEFELQDINMIDGAPKTAQNLQLVTLHINFDYVDMLAV